MGGAWPLARWLGCRKVASTGPPWQPGSSSRRCARVASRPPPRRCAALVSGALFIAGWLAGCWPPGRCFRAASVALRRHLMAPVRGLWHHPGDISRSPDQISASDSAPRAGRYVTAPARYTAEGTKEGTRCVSAEHTDSVAVTSARHPGDKIHTAICHEGLLSQAQTTARDKRGDAGQYDTEVRDTQGAL